VLEGLTSLDAPTADHLARSDAWDGRLPRLPNLDAETAKALAQFRGRELVLNGLTNLSTDAAWWLAQVRCEDLLLNGLSTLEVETAAAIAEFKGKVLALEGLTTIDAATIQSLARFRGKWLHLHALPVDAKAAKELAEAKAWTGYLPKLTAFQSPNSVDVARELAKRKGRLSLPNLKKLSPKTMSALLEKRDVEIPLVETLELIPEPDGSPNDDFVIPEGFEAQQKRKKQ
jgi:hypothetical protein